VSNGTPLISRQLLISVIPIFLGSFLFAGILESYKKDQGIQKELIKDYYRPMRALQSSCSSSHNNLFLKHGELSGSYQLMFNEFVHMSVTTDSKLGRDYDAIPMSIFKANSELKNEIEELEVVVEKCKEKLFFKYEELSLATGTYQEFTELAQKRTSGVDLIYAERKGRSKENTKEIDPNQLIPLMREFISMDLSNDKYKSIFMDKIGKIFDPVVNYSLIMAKTEQAIYQKESVFFQSLHKLYAGEISKKHSSGFFSWMF
jgi:hypothetical protein